MTDHPTDAELEKVQSTEDENVPSLSPSEGAAASTATRRAPDGGWGWVVVVASFFIHSIVDGSTFSFGTIYVELLSTFGESHSKTAFVGSLQVGFMLLPGKQFNSRKEYYIYYKP